MRQIIMICNSICLKAKWFLPFFLFTFLPLNAQRMSDEAQSYSKYIQAVDEYRPAPGQYVNDAPEYEDGDTEADMIRKCNENVAGKSPTDPDAHIIALGGWGGYITCQHPWSARLRRLGQCLSGDEKSRLWRNERGRSGDGVKGCQRQR